MSGSTRSSKRGINHKVRSDLQGTRNETVMTLLEVRAYKDYREHRKKNFRQVSPGLNSGQGPPDYRLTWT
jgi:ribosomal protein S13